MAGGRQERGHAVLREKKHRNLCEKLGGFFSGDPGAEMGCMGASCIEFLKALKDFIDLFLPSGRKGRTFCLLGALLSFSLFMSAQMVLPLVRRAIDVDIDVGLFDSPVYIEDIAFEKDKAITSVGRHDGNVSIPSVFEPNCDALLRGDAEEIHHTRTMLYREHRTSSLAGTEALLQGDCHGFVSTRGYPVSPASQVEERFPVAYIITVHHKFEQFERLLRAIYAPQNVYCVHPDAKSAGEFRARVASLAACFANVMIVSRTESVQYAGVSRLRADLHCMKDLLASSFTWRYVINLAGQDFPLKTNYELVQYLSSLNGTNDIPGVDPPDQNFKDRYRFKYEVRTLNNGPPKLKKTKVVHSPPPQDVTVLKGNAYYFAAREFVQYVLSDKLAQELLRWLEDVYSPDEIYWAALHRRPGTPGGVTKKGWGSKVRAIKWEHLEGHQYPACEGQHVRAVCVYGVGDLNWLTKRGAMFANKFDLDFDHMTIACLEQWLESKKKLQSIG